MAERPYQGNELGTADEAAGKSSRVRIVKRTSANTFAALKSELATVFSSNTVHPDDSTQTAQRARARFIGPSLAEFFIDYKGWEFSYSIPKPPPVGWVQRRMVEVPVPIASTYSDGGAIDAGPDGEVQHGKPLKALEAHITLVQQTTGSIDFSNGAEGGVNNASWYGLAAESVLYLGSSTTIYVIGSTNHLHIQHEFLYRRWLDGTVSLKPHVQIGTYWDGAASPPQYKLSIVNPATAILPTPL